MVTRIRPLDPPADETLSAFCFLVCRHLGEDNITGRHIGEDNISGCLSSLIRSVGVNLHLPTSMGDTAFHSAPTSVPCSRDNCRQEIGLSEKGCRPFGK